MNNLKTMDLKSGKYLYKITYKPTPGLPRVFLNKKTRTVSPRIRTTNTLYFDYRDQIVKEIIYPKNLWYTEIDVNDTVEKYIQDCIEFIPDWVKIEIKNLDEN